MSYIEQILEATSYKKKPSCMATYQLSQKPSKLNEQNMQDM